MKKKKPLPPRYKRMKRESRLQAAKHWIPKYEREKHRKGVLAAFWSQSGMRSYGITDAGIGSQR